MNRKTLLVIKLIVLILLLLVISFVAFAIIAFNGYSNTFSENLFSSESSFGQTAQKVQTFEDVQQIKLNLASIDVQIYETDSNIVTLYDNTQKEGFRIGIGGNDDNTVEFKNGKLTFTQGGTWNIGFNFIRITGDIIIEVPKGTQIEYEIDSASSDIYIDAPIKNTLKINNVSGEIEIMQGGEELNINTVSGDVEVFMAYEQIDIDCVSSDVKLVANSATKSIDFDGVSGDVEIEVEDDAKYDINFDAVSGDVDDDYENQNSDANAIQISINAVSGDAHLQNWR